MISNYSVNFLWHLPIKTTKSSLDVSHWNMELCCPQSTSYCRISVSVDHDNVWLFFQQYRLNAFQHFTRLGSLPTRTNAKVVVRRREIEFAEEYVAHVVFIMLAG